MPANKGAATGYRMTPGSMAVVVGERLRDRFGAGTVFVSLDAVTDPGLVLAAIGRAAGADLARTGSPLEAVMAPHRDRAAPECI